MCTGAVYLVGVAGHGTPEILPYREVGAGEVMLVTRGGEEEKLGEGLLSVVD